MSRSSSRATSRSCFIRVDAKACHHPCLQTMRESVFQSERESHCESLSQRENQRDSHKKLTPPRAPHCAHFVYYFDRPAERRASARGARPRRQARHVFDMYELDMTAATFGTCVWGFPGTHRHQGRSTQSTREHARESCRGCHLCVSGTLCITRPRVRRPPPLRFLKGSVSILTGDWFFFLYKKGSVSIQDILIPRHDTDAP